MIKILLRHTIIDTCISILFDELKKNFPSKMDSSKLFVGEYINVRILVSDSHYVLRGCRVDSQDGAFTYLKYDGFDSPIVLVTKDGDLVDIKGSYDTITEHFI
jgi:hypothetical protein